VQQEEFIFCLHISAYSVDTSPSRRCCHAWLENSLGKMMAELAEIFLACSSAFPTKLFWVTALCHPGVFRLVCLVKQHPSCYQLKIFSSTFRHAFDKMIRGYVLL